MVEDNGSKDGIKVAVKWCPFLDKYCIQERCALHSEITRSMGGLAQKITLCALNAVGMFLAEINQKTHVPPPQKINLPPGLFRQ